MKINKRSIKKIYRVQMCTFNCARVVHWLHDNMRHLLTVSLDSYFNNYREQNIDDTLSCGRSSVMVFDVRGPPCLVCACVQWGCACVFVRVQCGCVWGVAALYTNTGQHRISCCTMRWYTNRSLAHTPPDVGSARDAAAPTCCPRRVPRFRMEVAH